MLVLFSFIALANAISCRLQYHPILTQLLTQVDSNLPELTLPIRVDSNQLAFNPTPLESRVEVGWKGIG